VIIIIILFVIWFFVLSQTALAIESRDYIHWIAPTALIIGFISILTLATVALGHRLYFVIAWILAAIYLVIFPINIFAGLVVVFLAFGFWRAYHRTQFELHNNIKFAVSRILKRVTSITFLVFLLVISFNIYANIADEIKTNSDAFYSRLSASVTKGVLPIVERQFEDFQAEEPLDQFIVKSLIESAPEFRDLPAEEQQKQISQSRQRILDQFGISAAGSEPLSDITQRAVEERVKVLVQSRYEWMVPVVFGLAIFSLLRILSVIAGLIARVLGLFMFWILRKARFIKIISTQITAEQVQI